MSESRQRSPSEPTFAPNPVAPAMPARTLPHDDDEAVRISEMIDEDLKVRGNTR